MKHTRLVIFLLLFSFLSLSAEFSMAQMVATDQPFDNGAGNTGNAEIPVEEDNDPGCDPDLPQDQYPCPIDGGVVFLIAAGIGLAGKRAYNQKKDNKSFSH